MQRQRYKEPREQGAHRDSGQVKASKYLLHEPTGLCMQIEVTRAVGPGGPLQGVAEAPAGVNDVLAAAREDHRSSRRCLAQRSDSALMARPLETHQEPI